MDKVFINSLPKSGTNLIAKAMTLSSFKECRPSIGSHLVFNKQIRFRIIKLFLRPSKQNYLIGIDSPVEVNRNSIDWLLKRVKSGEFILGHIGYTRVFLQKMEESNFKKIQMIRDPRAVIASWVPFARRFKPHPFHKLFSKMTVKECYQVVLDGYSEKKISLESMYSRCKSIDGWLKSKDTLMVKFEDLVGSQGGGDAQIQREILMQICEHVGTSTEKVDYVIENLFGAGRHTYRKGKIDSWREEIPIDIQKDINEKLRPILEEWHYY